MSPPAAAGLLYLLDTNIVSDLAKHPDGPAAQRAAAALARAGDGATLAISAVVQCELLYGLAKRPAARVQQAVEAQLELLEVLPLDAAVAPHYAALRARLEALGTPIGPNDGLIAAHALSLGATLVSGDAEFARVPGLVLENWLRP
ncbi:PIN domain-containing protein [Xylophilus sp.]|uniref:PIN domain-containing protein n=1 Tax=Xylophilus sp. TaxID=2653893 RepID=UPI0013B9F612|nr:PIN domain-containing protein [Xylophilus sp.]KAF1047049.1 MAG: Ribonuclease VapC2 [Xylophilus sp.]